LRIQRHTSECCGNQGATNTKSEFGLFHMCFLSTELSYADIEIAKSRLWPTQISLLQISPFGSPFGILSQLCHH
jgi:hypothetical protein